MEVPAVHAFGSKDSNSEEPKAAHLIIKEIQSLEKLLGTASFPQKGAIQIGKRK